MTSNLAGREILQRARSARPDTGSGESTSMATETSADRELDEAVERALGRQFRPEFLNRIDEVIRFRPLAPGDLQRIVRLQLAELASLLREQHLELQVEEPVIAALAEQGYEPEYGARPLRRVLRRRIENPLATALLEERFSGAWGVSIALSHPSGNGGGQTLSFRPLFASGGESVR